MNKQQLANKIWASANKMRSKIEANEYKDYILGLIFYKFLSDNEVNYLKSIGWTDEDLVTLVEDHDNQEAVMMMPLAEFFREIANKELECKVSGFSSEARKALLTHSWPGNVRELRQKIMGAVLQAQTGLVTKEHLELGITETTSVTGFSLRNDEEDKERILRALKQADGNRKVAAELLGIGRTTLYNKLEEYGLKYKFEQP